MISLNPDLKPTSEKILDYVIYFSICAVTIFLPLVFSRSTTDQFLAPKEYFAQIASAAILFPFAIKLFLNGFKLRKNFLNFSILLICSWCTLSLLWNYNPECALRDLGNTFLIVLFFVYLVNVIHEKWQIELLLWCIVIPAVLTGILYSMESNKIYFRYDPVQNQAVYATPEIFPDSETRLAPYICSTSYYIPLFPEAASGENRIGTTFGNQNYFASFHVIVFFVGLALFLFYGNSFPKLVLFAVCFFSIFCILLSGCRAAFIGWVTGSIFLIFSIFKPGQIREFYYSLKKSPVFLLILIPVFSLSAIFFAQTNVFPRLVGTWNQLYLGHPRVFLPFMTVKICTENLNTFFLGKGFAGFKHYSPGFIGNNYDEEFRASLSRGNPGNAHNDPLQIVSELGVIGFGTIVYFCLCFFASAYNISPRELLPISTSPPVASGIGLGAQKWPFLPKDCWFVCGLISCFPAIIAVSMFDFPLYRISENFYLFILLGAISSFHCLSDTSDAAPRAPEIRRWVNGLLPAGMIFASILAVQGQLNSLKANTLFFEADVITALQNRNLLPLAEENLRWCVNLDPLCGPAYLQLAFINEMNNKSEEALKFADLAEKHIASTRSRFTPHSIYFRKMHIAYHVQKDYDAARIFAEMGLKLALSYDQEVFYYYLMNFSLLVNDSEEAEKNFNKTFRFLGSNFIWKSGLNLIEYYVKSGNFVQAMKTAGKLVEQTQIWKTSYNLIMITFITIP